MQAASSLNLKYLVKGVSPGKKKHTHNWMELEVNVILTTTKYAQRIDSPGFIWKVPCYDTMLYYSLLWAWNFESEP